MHKKVAALLADISGGDLRTDYSGRGMFGKETAGVVIDSIGDLLGAVLNEAEDMAENIQVLRDEGVEIPQGFRTDSMGYDTIIY
jgi:hypothetical protein